MQPSPMGGVAVLVGAERVLRVVQVDGAQAVEPNHAIELLQHAVRSPAML